MTTHIGIQSRPRLFHALRLIGSSFLSAEHQPIQKKKTNNPKLEMNKESLLKTITTLLIEFFRNKPPPLPKNRQKVTDKEQSRKGKEKWVDPETAAPKTAADRTTPPGTVGSWQRRFLPAGRTNDQTPMIRKDDQPAADARDYALAQEIDTDDALSLSGAEIPGIFGIGRSEEDRGWSDSTGSTISNLTNQRGSSRASSSATLIPTAESSSMGSGASSARVAKLLLPTAESSSMGSGASSARSAKVLIPTAETLRAETSKAETWGIQTSIAGPS